MEQKIVLADTIGVEVQAMPFTGNFLLECALTNKGTAFTDEERREFGLQGLLPPHVNTLEEQTTRAYQAYQQKTTGLERHIYLRALQDTNETLFYRLVRDHLTEMLPILYTPVVGEACQHFSAIYRRPRGLFISYPERNDIDAILDNAATPLAEVIVVTDGERILGLGDQGAGGMGIPIGKLSLYTAAAGIHPATTLPILLDVGTNNPDLLRDPLYLGWRHERIDGQAYDDFIEAFVQAVQRKFPHALLQWEDFAQTHAGPLLNRYRDRLCSFNDDIQGTAAVTMGTLLAAAKVAGGRLSDHRVAVFGAGSAGCGIAEQLIAAMAQEGLSEEEARARFYMIDRPGLLHDGLTDLLDFQQKLVQPRDHLAGWEKSQGDKITLADVVHNARPTILLGVSGQPGVFTEKIVREMAGYTDRPIIFPLSNPTSRVEAQPSDLIAWTDGRVLAASGSPFDDVLYGGRTYSIVQNNNSYIFPGIGLGVLAVRARRITDEMLMAAARALSECSPAMTDPDGSLLPPLSDLRQVSRRIALAIAAEAVRQGLTGPVSPDELESLIDAKMWEPRYVPMKRKALEQLSRRDELTGLYNQRVLNELIALEVTRAKRYGRPLCVFMVEINQLHRLSEIHGNETGNEILRRSAGIILDAVRKTDLATRCGGGEFCVLLPETPLAGAHVFADRIKERIAAESYTGEGGKEISVTCSIAVTEFNKDSDGDSRLLGHANQFLAAASGGSGREDS